MLKIQYDREFWHHSVIIPTTLYYIVSGGRMGVATLVQHILYDRIRSIEGLAIATLSVISIQATTQVNDNEIDLTCPPLLKQLY